MMPKFVDRKQLSIVMNMTDGSPYAITSLDDFLQSINVTDFSLETLVPSSLRRRISKKPSFAKDRVDRELADSVTIENHADEDGNLLEPFEMSDIAAAVNKEWGTELTPDALELTDGQIEKHGLYTCIAQVDSITKKKIKVWVVPKA